MARYNIKSVVLASELGLSTNAIAGLRKAKSMPRLNGDSLNKLCNALNKLAQDLEEDITPVTLINYVRDPEPGHPYISSAQPTKIVENDKKSFLRKNNKIMSPDLEQKVIKAA